MNVLDYAVPMKECPTCGHLSVLEEAPFNDVERVPGSVQYFEDELDIDKELYYYCRDGDNDPMITVCLLISSDGLTSRGIAICSPMDNPNKSVGRGYARDRAYDAMYHEVDDDPIESQLAKYVFYICDMSVPEFKQQFNPELSNFERYVLLQKG